MTKTCTIIFFGRFFEQQQKQIFYFFYFFCYFNFIRGQICALLSCYITIFKLIKHSHKPLWPEMTEFLVFGHVEPQCDKIKSNFSLNNTIKSKFYFLFRSLYMLLFLSCNFCFNPFWKAFFQLCVIYFHVTKAARRTEVQLRNINH